MARRERFRKISWSIGSSVLVLIVLIVFFFPVTQNVETWSGHVQLEWSFLKFVRVWNIQGHQPQIFLLVFEAAVAAFIGVLVWAGMSEAENRATETRRGTL